MAVERTLSIIKPDAVAKNVIGEIYSRFERAGLRVVAAKMTWLARPDAGGYYAVHRERPFFKSLVEFMTSGPLMLQVLEGENAIAKNRDLMRAANDALDSSPAGRSRGSNDRSGQGDSGSARLRRRDLPARSPARFNGERRNSQMVARCGRRQRHRGGVYPGGRPRRVEWGPRR